MYQSARNKSNLILKGCLPCPIPETGAETSHSSSLAHRDRINSFSDSFISEGRYESSHSVRYSSLADRIPAGNQQKTEPVVLFKFPVVAYDAQKPAFRDQPVKKRKQGLRFIRLFPKRQCQGHRPRVRGIQMLRQVFEPIPAVSFRQNACGTVVHINGRFPVYAHSSSAFPGTASIPNILSA